MNRYPIWKYLIILFALVISILYTIPNFFGESPAIQVSPGKATVKVTDATMAKVEDALRSAGIKPQAVHLDAGSQPVERQRPRAFRRDGLRAPASGP